MSNKTKQLELGFKPKNYELVNTNKPKYVTENNAVNDRYIKTIKFNNKIYDVWKYPSANPKNFLIILSFDSGPCSVNEIVFQWVSGRYDHTYDLDKEHPELYEIAKFIAIEEGFFIDEQ